VEAIGEHQDGADVLRHREQHLAAPSLCACANELDLVELETPSTMSATGLRTTFNSACDRRPNHVVEERCGEALASRRHCEGCSRPRADA
jgi:hypothetical protein